ncbi:hypothetical protein TELCIR_08794 [Teladorsagia circumcincta]|uniref:Carboxylesterase type B domain-containing protein n=1 Tax=Teladorsagia circumcincta TaxID=45464 RepID=A0A2G9UGS0_TELCI|nr:hypothetical protein TELCIR_08794 [Teladorsagia circumcincta]
MYNPDLAEYGPACMSNSSITTSPQKWVDEDCLHVNIFAGAECMVKACPVAFYIHGGGFNYDSAVMFKDDALINNFGGNGDFLNFEDQELLYIESFWLFPECDWDFSDY